ncbi:MAG: PilZ domain-containing protein [Candidatus Hydrogenedentes bacterium]|nr:PilZ domain-containing protein [Candidatus Hydrogenedentota bacterium]
MARQMTVMLVSREPQLLRPTKFALEREGFAVVPVVREPDIASDVSESGVDIIVLDAGFGQEGTGRIAEQVKGDPKFAETVLILFSTSRAQLQRACVDRDVLKNVDDVLVEMFDGSDLVDKVKSAAKRMKMGRSKYNRQASEWKDPYAASSIDERREDERFSLDAPVTVRGKDLLGEPFEEETSMLNLSAGGAYLKSDYHVEDNTGLEISVRAPHAPGGIFDIRGAVVRMEQGIDRREPKRRRVAVRFGDDVRQNIDFHLLLAKLSGTG